MKVPSVAVKVWFQSQWLLICFGIAIVFHNRLRVAYQGFGRHRSYPRHFVLGTNNLGLLRQTELYDKGSIQEGHSALNISNHVVSETMPSGLSDRDDITF